MSIWPWLLGSGKLGTPWDRMHEEKASLLEALEPDPPLITIPDALPGPAVPPEVAAPLGSDDEEPWSAEFALVPRLATPGLALPLEQAAAKRAVVTRTATTAPERRSRGRPRGSDRSVSMATLCMGPAFASNEMLLYLPLYDTCGFGTVSVDADLPPHP